MLVLVHHSPPVKDVYILLVELTGKRGGNERGEEEKREEERKRKRKRRGREKGRGEGEKRKGEKIDKMQLWNYYSRIYYYYYYYYYYLYYLYFDFNTWFYRGSCQYGGRDFHDTHVFCTVCTAFFFFFFSISSISDHFFLS